MDPVYQFSGGLRRCAKLQSCRLRSGEEHSNYGQFVLSEHARALSGALTIGSSALTWFHTTLAPASQNVSGSVFITTQGNQAAALGTPGNAAFDCLDINTAGAPTPANPVAIGDDGNAAGTTGGCITGDPQGHPILNGTGTAPVVTGTGCSLVVGGQDNRGAITAAGVDTCTLTFAGSGFTFAAPVCSIGNVGATVLAYLNALPSAAAAVFKTTAAGTFTYTCF